ncbi:interferon gamma receptor 2 precursor [Acanthochromis polyacanthus]|uniref:Interferon gamma receptor 2 n=1 Tax=Acanthochromis polyacanthus TaxID=80966 RepID=A0A3Q1FS12_9TELE|nr:interferon gamma receptor 2 precursor [Acanthochromis polyacanthus]
MCSETRRTLRNDAATMFFVLLCLQNFVQVLSEATLLPPKNIRVDKWQLRWSPATKERDIMYTVQYRSFNTDEWKVVPACVQIVSNSCNVASTKAKGEHGCVMLRVLAEKNGLTSIPVKACSRHGDSCDPDFNLIARPGSLTVRLASDHSLTPDFAEFAKHRIYFGKQGEQLKKYTDVASSETIRELEEGQRYCVQVQYIATNNPVGLASCIQCELIPQSGDSTQTLIIVSVLVVFVLVAVIPGVTYILIFQRKKIKRYLQPYNINIMPELFEPIHISILPSSQSDEHFDVLSSITPEEFGGK